MSCALPAASIHSSPSADQRPGDCAWFGDPAPDGQVLYFGISAFWSAYRAGKGGADPNALLAGSGPARIGRFDLRNQQMLEPLEIQAKGSSAGIWDVLAHPNGRVYFSSFFEGPGVVDPATGAVERFAAAGRGLTELAFGPGDSWVGSRYGAKEGESGAVVLFDPDGHVVEEWPLPSREGERLAPKTPAWDPGRGAFWVTTDSLPEGQEHPTLVIDRSGKLAFRIDSPEVQFVRFDATGHGWLAVADGPQLSLWLLDPGSPLEGLEFVRQVTLDEDFATGLDFVQDIQLAVDGRALVTRWSGVVHVVTPSGATQRLALPREEGDGQGGLYHTAVESGREVCATLCGGVRVVCAPLGPR